MIDLEKHAYMLQCYKCYNEGNSGVEIYRLNLLPIITKRLQDLFLSS